ncbi:MAG TPA: carboxypeptidase-like regulatory domain-containing protein [Bryobacteraceae bacterium]|nr:carboxypeptidase-like regulatory domain-containing protein [Bryobacteraceae bacterium]
MQSLAYSQAQPEKCALNGTAVDFVTAAPLRKVTIRLIPSRASASGYMGVTDAEGHFHLGGIAAGNYDLTGEHTGYLLSEYGARRPSGTGTTLNLKAGDKLTDVKVKLVRCSVIAGKITDDDGEPIRKALVYAVSQQWLRGERTYDQSDDVWTNDRGEYRITGLTPGRYYLCAGTSSESFVEKQGGQEMQVLPTCYPYSRSPDGASQVEVQAGQDALGLDMRMPVGPVFHIRGKLEMTASDHQQRLSLEAHLHNFGGEPGGLDEGVDDEHGTFDFSGATPGDYDIDWISEDHQVVARRSVTVKTSDVNGIILTLPKRFEITGTVHSSTGDQPLAELDVTAKDMNSPASEPYSGDVGPGGAFKIENVWPSKYVFGVSFENPGEYVKSIQYGGREILGQAIALTGATTQIEVLMGTDARSIDGLVQPADSNPIIGGLQVVLVLETPRLDNESLLLARTDQNGHFSFKNVPPGRYYAFAVADVDPGLLENRNFIGQLEGSALEADLPGDGKLPKGVPIVPPDEVQRALNLLGQ